MTINAPNDYSGATFIQQGTLKLGASEVIPNGTGKSDPIINGVLDLAGFNETVNEFSGTGVITNSTGTLSTFTFGMGTTTGGFDGGFAGPVQALRVNAGTFTLRGSSTHTGGTIVQRGRLDLANTNGQCLASDLTLEGVAGTPSGNVVRLGASEQIADTARVIYAGNNDKDLRFSMMGFNETLAGIVSAVTATNNVIFEAASDQVSNAPAVLTIVSPAGQTNVCTAGNVYLRDAAFGTLGSATNNPGFVNPSPLTVVKTGPGTQVFGVNGPYTGSIGFSGGLRVDQGTFVLLNAAASNSRITNDATLVLDLNTFPPTDGPYGLSYATNYWQSNSVSGSGTIIKKGDATLVLDGPVAQGALIVESGGLSGVGTISAPVTLAAGARLAPGSTTNNSYLPFPLGLAPADPGIGLLTINNTLTLDAASTTVMELDKANGTHDAVAGITTLTYGGTLTVTNLGGTFVGGESYVLFSAASYVGNFSATNLPPLDPGLNWVWNPATGTLSVSGGVPSTPTNLTFAVSGGGTTLELSWPPAYLGWLIQSNAVSVADTNAWFDVAGSDSVTSLTLPIQQNVPQVYYRMRKP
jgi:autotransporter-associated beta strand protein